jgi:ribonucleotide monophosphatase NagD (HAD superfamily)
VAQEAEGVDVVVVSFDRTFDYRKLKVAFDAVRGRARRRRQSGHLLPYP